MAADGFNDIVMKDALEPIVQWHIGDVTITKLVETEMTRSVEASLPNADLDALTKLSWLRDDFSVATGNIAFSFHSFVIETASRTLVVDTCFGNDKTRPGLAYCDHLQLPFLANLELSGYKRSAIDTVICTHFHNDHVGWNTMLTGEVWEPTFPNARYLFNDAELSYWTAHLGRDGGGGIGDSMIMAFADSVAPIREAGLVDLVRTDHDVCDEVRLIATPGHTPGHVGVVIESKGEYGLITGDAIHHPLQLADPRWSSGFDFDDACAVRTRTAILDNAVDTGALLMGTHWVGSAETRIVRDGSAFRLSD